MDNYTSNQLIYIWYEQYKDGLIQRQGISLTGEYHIAINGENEENEQLKKQELAKNTLLRTVSISIQKNPEYFCPKDFYGKNINMLTMIAGENGSGKTTLAQMLMNDPFARFDESPPFFWITHSETSGFTVYNHKVTISRIVCENNEKIECKPWEENPISLIFATNVFNFYELKGDISWENLERSGRFIRRSYSPASMLCHVNKEAKKVRYGYRTADNRYLMGLQYYAEMKESSPISSYIKKQEELMIQCYRTTSPEVREMLGIFKEYTFNIHEFMQDFTIQTNLEILDEIPPLLLAAKGCNQKLKQRILRNNEDSFLLNVYVLCLSEAYLVLNENQGRDLSSIKSKIEYTETLNRQTISLLREIVASVQSAPWAAQIQDCLDMLEEYMDGQRRDWKLGSYTFDENTEMVDWYYHELIKPNSFFKRNFSFQLKPSSSGEQAMVNLFGYLSDAINQMPDQREFLVIIDEIDAGLHPRWQQNCLKYLLDWLNSFQGYQFQLILTSHSPVVLSDVVKEHVVRLKKTPGKLLVTEYPENSTFGANIARQFFDTFFMDQGNIGAFAKEKIRDIIDRIQHIQQGDLREYQELIYLINAIGEELVRNKLMHDLEQKMHRSNHSQFIEQWEECSEEEQQKIIDYIKQMRMERKKHDLLEDSEN